MIDLNYGMTTMARFEQMRLSMASWVTLTDFQWGTLKAIFSEKELAAKEHLFHPDSQTHQLVFVSKGLLRFYYLNADGTESNKAFVTENTFAGSLAAASLQMPVLYGVEALEPSVLLTADLSEFRALYNEHPVFDQLGRHLAELILMRKELRTRSFLQQNATERYLDFLKNRRDLLARVPQYHIASFLGITEVSLSRLKKESTESLAL